MVEATRVCGMRKEPRERTLGRKKRQQSEKWEEDSFKEGNPNRFKSCPEARCGRERNVWIVFGNGRYFSILRAIQKDSGGGEGGA